MSRVLFLLYGVLCYVVFFVTFCYAICFVGDIEIANLIPRTVDRGGPEASFATALAINVALLGLFGLQHSIMARPAFKRWWIRIVPEPIERSTFVIIASLLLVLMYWQWRPMPDEIWSIGNAALSMLLWILFGIGWVMVLLSTFLINHFDLFGLRQVWFHFRNVEYHHVGMRQPFLYRMVRHPLMLGFIIAFWATPLMTVGHLVFAIVTTAYILVAIQIEERDLIGFIGEDYIQYRKNVPMILPIPKRKGG